MYSNEDAVHSLVKLMNEVQLAELNIGDYEKEDGKYSLVVIGNDITEEYSSKRLKKVESTSIQREVYIDESLNGEMRALLNKECRFEEAASIMKKLKSINNGKLAAVLLKAKTEVYVRQDDRYEYDRVKLLRFIINSDTKKMEMHVLTYGQRNKKGVEINIEEYNSTLVVNSNIITDAVKTLKNADKAIYVMPCGLIRTICIVNGNHKVFIDNSNIVCNEEILGTWRENRIAWNDGVDESIKSIIAPYEKFIAMHHKYIVPYKICKANYIEI